MNQNNNDLRALGENHMVSRFRRLAGAALTEGVLLGPGDDAAVLRLPPGRVALFTCDMMAEGVHFRTDWATPWQLGWKAMAVNLSDIAAMGGEPGFAVASLSLPGSAPQETADQIAQGLIAAASRFGAALVGGDLVGSTGPITVDVALLGWVEEDLLLRRSGARTGDALCVTGALGASAAGLHALQAGLPRDDPLLQQALAVHLEPQPRVREGRAIANSRRATAMMDLSDGLAMDVPRLCAESDVGARLYAARLPVADSCREVAARLGLDPLSLTLRGGEDYELLFTCPPEAVEPLFASLMQIGTHATVIGEVSSGSERILVSDDGRELPLGDGFDHFAL